MSELVEALRNAKYDKQATAKDVETYLHQNAQMSHDVIVVSSR